MAKSSSSTSSPVARASFRCRRILSLLLASTVLGGAILESGRPAFAQATAETANFQIPAQSLSSAINAFIRQSGWQISYSSALVRGKTSSAVSGNLSPDAALRRLVSGTGIEVRVSAPGSAALTAPADSAAGLADDGSILLGTIFIDGESAWGSVDGFVAKQSAAGTKTDTAIIETPYSVSVVTQDQIEHRNVQTTGEALRYSPGVLTSQSIVDRRGDTTKQSIRGFPATGLFDGTLLSGNGGYTSSISLDPYLLQRAEVLGGPASVLYGQTSPGGTINFTSKRPTEQGINEIVVGTGNYGRIQGAFDVGGRLDEEGTLLYRLTGIGLNSGTQVDYVKDQRLAIAPAFTWAPTDDTSLTILLSYQYDPAKSAQSSMPWVGSFFPTSAGARIPRHFFAGEPDYNEFERTQVLAGYEFRHRFNEVWSFQQNFKYVDIDGEYRDIYANGFQADGISLNRTAYGEKNSFHSFYVDNQAKAEFSTGPADHQVLLGLDAYRTYLHTPWYIWGSVPAINVLSPNYGVTFSPPVKTPFNSKSGIDQLGLYAQDYVSVDRWRFLFGVRHDWVDTWSQSDAAPKVTKSDSATTWRAGASYLFDNGVAPYVSYSTSFQPQSGTTHPERGGDAFTPTTGQQFEVGFKYQPDGLESLLTLSAFDIKQQNVLTVDPIYPGYSIQKGEVHSRGVTTSVTSSLTDNLNVLASYTYLDIETSKGTRTDTFDTVGKVPWHAPRHVASLWADYTFDHGVANGLRLGAGVRYVGAGYTDSREQYKLPSYMLVDAALSYDFGAANPDLTGLEGSLNITNLFDKEYLHSCTQSSCWWGDGRTITAQLKYRW